MRPIRSMPIGSWSREESGFALLTVFWLAVIGLFAGSLTLAHIYRRTQSLRTAKQSLELSLLIESVFNSSLVDRLPLPKGWQTTADTLLSIGEPRRDFWVQTRRWGLWAVAEVGDASQPGGPVLARRLLIGRRQIPSNMVLAIRTNLGPLVLADRALIGGVVAVSDSVIVNPWKGYHYARPRPPFRSGVLPFAEEEGWDGFPEAVTQWIEEPDARPAGLVLLQGPATLSPGMLDGSETLVCAGDLRIAGVFGAIPVCVYVTGELHVVRGTVACGQFVSEGAIVVEDAVLEWPSLLASGCRRSTFLDAAIRIAGSSHVDGLIFAQGLNDPWPSFYQAELAMVTVGEDAVVRGGAYVRGAFDLAGAIHGFAEVGETFERDGPATYHNWLLDGSFLPFNAAQSPIPYPLSLGSTGRLPVTTQVTER